MVPRQALTLTIPVLISAGHVVCTVPATAKAKAVKKMIYGPISTNCPASILRLHKDCSVFLDGESGRDIV
jgi:glucosamine-6-phosphate deaminase